MARRFNKDVKDHQHKNYWNQLEMLVDSRKLRETTLEKKEEYDLIVQVQDKTLNNMPLKFIQPENYNIIRKLRTKATQYESKNLVLNTLK